MLAGVVGSAACSSMTESSGTKNVTATVRFLSIEGGFYALRGDDSVTYDPTNLAKSFQVDGLRVQSRLTIRNGAVGIHAVGSIVDIVEIQKL
jgi:hypothetical protein